MCPHSKEWARHRTALKGIVLQHSVVQGPGFQPGISERGTAWDHGR